MMRFEGDRQFPVPPDNVFLRLGDAQFLVGSILGHQPVGTPSEDEAQCLITPHFAFMRGSMELTVRIAEAIPPTNLRVVVQGRGYSCQCEAQVLVTFAERAGGTRLHWTAEIIKLEGLLAVVPTGQIETAAQKVIQDSWSQLSARLNK